MVSEELRAQLKTVLDREAETHRRHDAKVEAQAAEIKRLREALSDILTRFEPWSPHDYLADKAARAALGETP